MMLDLAKIAVRTYELNEVLYTNKIILFKQVYVR